MRGRIIWKALEVSSHIGPTRQRLGSLVDRPANARTRERVYDNDDDDNGEV